MPWWAAFLCLPLSSSATCVYLEETNRNEKKTQQIIHLKLATHFSLTWAIFLSVQPRAPEDLCVSSCNHSSRLQPFQRPHPFLGSCPCVFPLHLAWAHSNTNRFGEHQAWPGSRQIWQFFSLKFSWLSQFMVSIKVLSILKVPHTPPPAVSNLGSTKVKACQTTAADAFVSTEHHHSILIIKLLHKKPHRVIA